MEAPAVDGFRPPEIDEKPSVLQKLQVIAFSRVSSSIISEHAIL